MALKIYVSSTYEDLKAHRERVYHQLRSLRHDVIAMEDYVAADQRPLDRCLQDVRDASVYVGLFAWRYGYVPGRGNPAHKSITELEYAEAKRHHKPRLLFLLKDTAAWPGNLMDSNSGDHENGAKIRRLRDSLRKERMVGMFETADELAAKVVASLYMWQTETAADAAPAVEHPVERRERHQKAAKRRDKPLLWVPGSRLRVRFLAGDPAFRARVMRLAQIWSAYADIGFVESEDQDAEIRVVFEEQGTWSVEGTSCLSMPESGPTMCLGWLRPDSPIEDLETVVLHEFGHVLGLAHEHNNPAGAVPWNKDRVYKMLKATQGWTKEEVDQMIFGRWSEDRFPFRKPFDPLSIMAYTFPADLTGGEQIFPRNLALSAGDKEFVSRLYPYPGMPRRKRSRAASARPDAGPFALS